MDCRIYRDGEDRLFNGRRYVRFVGSSYYRCIEKRVFRYLHRDVWSHYNGTIPPGYHVHHVDEDRENNDISNLECIPAQEHFKEHFDTRSRQGRICVENGHMNRMQEMAKKWHSSEAGLAWHVEHGKRVFQNMPTKHGVCDVCASPMTYTTRTARFCSNNCKSQYRRVSGVDNIGRRCVICNSSFNANKYSTKATCSRSCGATLSICNRKRNDYTFAR